MELIVLHGPPAVSKLTVAREASALTGFPLFHNHLVVDTVTAVFPFGTLEFRELRDQLWLAVMGRAAAEGMPGLIFTLRLSARRPTVLSRRLRRW